MRLCQGRLSRGTYRRTHPIRRWTCHALTRAVRPTALAATVRVSRASEPSPTAAPAIELTTARRRTGTAALSSIHSDGSNRGPPGLRQAGLTGRAACNRVAPRGPGATSRRTAAGIRMRLLASTRLRRASIRPRRGLRPLDRTIAAARAQRRTTADCPPPQRHRPHPRHRQPQRRLRQPRPTKPTGRRRHRRCNPQGRGCFPPTGPNRPCRPRPFSSSRRLNQLRHSQASRGSAGRPRLRAGGRGRALSPTSGHG
jgi:hypothetical protein